MELNRVAIERVGSMALGAAFLTIGISFLALGVTWLPVIGFFLAAPFLFLALLVPKIAVRGRSVHVLAGSTLIDYINHVGRKRNRVIPLTIFSTSETRESRDFDATRIEVSSVRFGPNEVAPVQEPVRLPAVAARQGEGAAGGKKDLVFYFPEDGSGITPETREVCVSGRTVDGEDFYGCTPYRTNA